MTDIGAMLEAGRSGVDFLTSYLPLAQRVSRPAIDLSTLEHDYYAERAISLDELNDCRARLDGARSTLVEAQRLESATSLATADPGPMIDRIEAASRALKEAVEAINSAVSDKSRRVGDLAHSSIDGRSRGEVEVLVDAAVRADPFALTWVEGVFVPSIEKLVESFRSSCDSCASEVRQALSALTDSVRPADQHGVIRPSAGPL